MRKHIVTLQQERGQTLVLVALVLVALMVAAALAVDVGHLYAERRHMQNAADAAALEAARLRCFANEDPISAALKAPAYALPPNNRAEWAIVAPIDLGSGGWTFEALALENAETFFARAIGINSVQVHATARSACGVANTSCSLFPIAFLKSQWDGLVPTCNKTFYVWSSQHDNDNNPGPTCDDCNCDIDPTSPGLEVITETGRAWLDFTDISDPLYPDTCAQSTGCGASELKCWISGDSPARVKLPACISGDTGVKAGVHNDIEDRSNLFEPNNLVRIPIYTGRCPAAKAGCSGDGFYVTDFGCVKLMGWQQQLTVYKKNDPTAVCWKGKVIKAAVSCHSWCSTRCGSTTGDPPGKGDIRSISLTD